jgi:type VI secretion system protein VasG
MPAAESGARNIDSLLNQQILPVLSQQLLMHQAAQQTCTFETGLE